MRYKPSLKQRLAALAAAVLLLPGAAAQAEDVWDVSRSKTAANLDAAYESRVTLSLPSAEETLISDVVFVLDESSCSDPVKAEVAQMLETLYTQVRDTGAAIRIGAVQFRGEVTTLPLTELTETTKETVAAFMSARPETGGSNLSAGLLAGRRRRAPSGFALWAEPGAGGKSRRPRTPCIQSADDGNSGRHQLPLSTSRQLPSSCSIHTA